MRKVNVETGKQGFQETAKKQSSVGLDGIVVDTTDEYDYVQPFVFNGAPDEGMRFNVVNATAMNDSDEADHLIYVLPSLSREQAEFHQREIKEAWDNGAVESNRAVSAAMVENMAEGRKWVVLDINPNWAEPTVTEDGGYKTWTGCKYDPAFDVTETAKRVRRDLANAIGSGFIPDGNYSVRTKRYAGGCSLYIEAIVPGNPEDFHNRDVIGFDDRQIALRELDTRLNVIAEQYAQNTVSPGLSEGGRSNFYHHVGIGFFSALM